jgi:ATP-binding cassette subfamily F protein 3
MQSVNILIQALQQYEGTYVVVSHDRYFVSNIANKIWYIEDHEIKEYPGSFDEYETWMATRESAKPVSVKAAVKAKPELAPVEVKTPIQAKQIEKLEAEIMEIENRIAAIEVQMVDLANKADYAGLKQLEASLAAEKANLSETTTAWEALI